MEGEGESMKLDKEALFDYNIIKDYVQEFGITSMTEHEKHILKGLAKGLLERQIRWREGNET